MIFSARCNVHCSLSLECKDAELNQMVMEDVMMDSYSSVEIDQVVLNAAHTS